MKHDVLILGASTRAAAFSAIRAGLRPRCADYFADRDLAAICPVDRIDPHHAARQFRELAEKLALAPWFYTGGFENHPHWVTTISRRHTLLGAGAQVLRRVRDPFRVAAVLARHEIPCPAVRTDSVGLPRDGSWLKKPLRSSGGRGIEPLTFQNDSGSPRHYFQERIDGPSFSALFIGETSRAQLIGATQQLIGSKRLCEIPGGRGAVRAGLRSGSPGGSPSQHRARAFSGSPFTYRGSIGPWPICAPLTNRLKELGNAITGGFGLAGWFGVDFILNNDVPWPVEINPRYTASVELYELAWRRSLFGAHRRACEVSANAVEPPIDVAASPPRIIAKSILYAARQLVVPAIVPQENDQDDRFAVGSIADIPYPETCVNAGEPVMTLLAAGADLADCNLHLIQLEQHWSARLGLIGDLCSSNTL